MHIIIAPYKEKIITSDGAEMIHHPLLINLDSKTVDLRDHRKIGQINELSFSFNNGKKIRHLPLDKNIINAVINFLKNYHENEDISFDCYAFVNTVAGHTDHPKEFLQKFWSLERHRFWRRKVGSILFFLDNHATIYLGYGYYLSIHGAGGELVVTKLQDMLKCYKYTEDIMIASKIG